jgi:hypothetical protein
MRYEYFIIIFTLDIGDKIKNSNEHISFYNINDKNKLSINN